MDSPTFFLLPSCKNLPKTKKFSHMIKSIPKRKLKKLANKTLVLCSSKLPLSTVCSTWLSSLEVFPWSLVLGHLSEYSWMHAFAPFSLVPPFVKTTLALEALHSKLNNNYFSWKIMNSIKILSFFPIHSNLIVCLAFRLMVLLV